MAVFNEILVGRFNRYLQKFTGIKGGPPTPALGTEISGQFDLNSVMMEDRVLLSIDCFWLNTAAGPTAAQASAVRLRNPGGSNVIAIVEFIGFTETVTDTPPGIVISIGANLVDLSSSSPAAPLDTRSQRSASTCIISSQTGAAPLTTAILATPAAANTFFGLTLYEAMEIPLLPGRAIQVTTTVANTLLNANFKWRERALEDSEQKS